MAGSRNGWARWIVPKLDAAGAPGDHRQGRPALHDPAIVAVHQVVGDPDRVVAEPLGLDGRVDGRPRVELGPGGRAEEGRAGVGEERHAESQLGRRRDDSLQHSGLLGYSHASVRSTVVLHSRLLSGSITSLPETLARWWPASAARSICPRISCGRC